MPKMRKIDPPLDDEPDDLDDYDEDEDDDDEEYGEGWGWHKPSRPIRTDKGIKARSRRGAFGDKVLADVGRQRDVAHAPSLMFQDSGSAANCRSS